jgi:hypothetical protein|uniref:Methyltransferase FkbM domain-containing protein n=1 Tax=viral metagenome TaxID=1070528 RepID=A0A6C0BJT8_9ZZZZ
MPIPPYNAQAGQDEFVVEMLHHKKDGCFLELGSNDPKQYNNTYYLEHGLGWVGIMVEYEAGWLPTYQKQRPRSFPIISDATKIDYWQALADHHFPKQIDYLQMDLDVDTRSTLTTLEKLDATVLPQYTFATITFEHDIYTGNYFETRQRSREILEHRGYVRIFSDVSVWWHDKSSPVDKLCPFEDWYVHPSLVDKQLLEKIASDPVNVPGQKYDVYVNLVKKYTHTNTN